MNEDTQKILDILKKNDVHVTFFMTGGWVNSYPDDVKAIDKAGHELGNHSENHKQMSTLSASECKDEIMKVHEKVKELTGKDMCVFRPPYGDYNDNLINVVKECGYNAIQWDVDIHETGGINIRLNAHFKVLQITVPFNFLCFKFVPHAPYCFYICPLAA